MTAISNEVPAPDAVLDTIDDYVAQLGEYFSQHNITYSVTCNVAAGVSVDSRVWTAGVQPDQTMFIGSAVKTFMLAEYLRSDLSEMAVMDIDDSVRSISSTVFGDQTFAGEPRPDMKLDGETLARSVLEAMITHSDNTATDAVLRPRGPKRTRADRRCRIDFGDIPDLTRQLFSYLASGQDVPVGWETLKQYVDHPPNTQNAINEVQSMLASASDMVRSVTRRPCSTRASLPPQISAVQAHIVDGRRASRDRARQPRFVWQRRQHHLERFQLHQRVGANARTTNLPGTPVGPRDLQLQCQFGRDDGATFNALQDFRARHQGRSHGIPGFFFGPRPISP